MAMKNSGWGSTRCRRSPLDALFAACKTVETESPRDGLTWLTTEVKEYASNRSRILELLEFMASLRRNGSMPHWHQDAQAAEILAGVLRNRQDNV